MEFYIPLIWAVLIAVGILLYTLLDGFDLGVGILFPFAKSEKERNLMMNSVAPVWDGNETWLILGGGGLLVAFPLAYAVILPAFYIPVILMLMALIFRGVAFEFRHKADTSRRIWDIAFPAGSAVAAFCQGMMLGAFIQGIDVQDRSFAGGALDFLTPFSVFTGFAVVFGYAMLGAGWLILKTEGALQGRMYKNMLWLTVAVLVFMGGVSLWTPLTHEGIFERWFSWPNTLLLSPVPILTLVAAGYLYRSVVRKSEGWPYILANVIFLLAYIGLGISLWPNMVPPEITIWEAAAPEKSQVFSLIGVVILLPIILGYTGYSYWVFRGKAKAEEGYH